MWVSFWILLVLGVVLGIVAYLKGVLLKGLMAGGNLFISLIPVLVVAFIVGGLFQTIVPREIISRIMGKEAGIRGVILGWLIGIIMPGGPYVNFPIMVALYKSGASLGSVCAMLSSWGLLSIFRFITYEVPILGGEIALPRYAVSFVFPLVIGLIVWGVFR